MLPAPADLLGHVADAVLRAGVMLRAEFHRPGGPRGSGSKAPIDDEVEVMLRDRLMSLHQCGWHGEETGSAASSSPDTWVVDPQDGTRAFLKGLRGAAISVALIRNGAAVLGIVYAPTAPDDGGDFFAWAEGLPPTRNGVPLEALAPRSTFAPETVVALNEEAGDFAAANYRHIAHTRVLAVPSIAYRLALAAAGEVDVSISFTQGLDPYDIAGGHALLTAVGGELKQLDERPITYRPGTSFNGCIGGGGLEVDVLLCCNVGARGTPVPRTPARPIYRVASALMLSRAQGAMLGQLAGDALGSAVEFRMASDIADQFPNGVRDLKDGGTWNLLAGQPTDDSEMALALARSLVEEGKFDEVTVGRAYVTWGASGPFDIGGTTSAGLAAIAGHGQPNCRSQSNGALMRVSPIGVFAVDRPGYAARLAARDAAMTHPHPVCIAASAAFAAAISVGVSGADPSTMVSVALAHAGSGDGAEVVRQTILHALDEPPADYLHNIGWVLIALGNAFHRLAIRQPLEDALIETVGEGGDTDTNAAIAGALLGAAQGRKAVPARWRRAVLSCRAVSEDGVAHPRPKDYWPDDAMDLAEALLVAGRKA
ncbi:hypothetical protein DYI42_05785 [Vannielia litorea]|nr:hypothetical protein [Vannielia litorea]